MNNDNTGEANFQAVPFTCKCLVSREGLTELQSFGKDIKAGKLSPVKIGQAVDFLVSNIQDFLDEWDRDRKARDSVYISINEAALILGKSKQAIYQKIQRGTIPPECIWKSANGRTVKILATRLQEFR